MPASWFTNRNTSVPGIPPIIKVEDVPDISSMVQDTDGPEPIAIVGIGKQKDQ